MATTSENARPLAAALTDVSTPPPPCTVQYQHYIIHTLLRMRACLYLELLLGLIGIEWIASLLDSHAGPWQH